MTNYEYKVVTAPRKAGKAKGVRGHDEKYAHTLGELMNGMAADGWQYLRAESLPVDEKAGMMGKTTEKYLSVLVFQREKAGTAADNLVKKPQADPMVLGKSISDDEFDANVASLGPATRD